VKQELLVGGSLAALVIAKVVLGRSDRSEPAGEPEGGSPRKAKEVSSKPPHVEERETLKAVLEHAPESDRAALKKAWAAERRKAKAAPADAES
jgi:hypothetical protein